MKKLISILLSLAVLLSLAACGSGQTPAPATTAPTEPVPTTQPVTEPPTEPAPTEPPTVPGVMRASLGELIFCDFDRGDEVTVIGEFLDYFVIRGEEADLLLEKQFVRLSTEEPFQERNGYTKWNAPLYDNPYFSGEPLQNFRSNFKVTVVDGKDGWLYVEWDDGFGYVPADQVRDRPATSSGGGGGGGGNSGGGGGGDGSDVPMGSLSHREPGIELLGAYSGPAFTAMEDTPATVLVPEARGYLALLNRDDTVQVISADEQVCTVWYNGFQVTAPRWLIRLEEDVPMEPSTCYARYGSQLYSEYQLRNSVTQLKKNTVITVLDELPECYVVEVDGVIGYMNPAETSPKRISSSGGGGNSGGGGGSEWTPPAM